MKHDLMVMENLTFGRNITRQYDLKGALHARYNSTTNDPGNVLLDQNFVNDMNTSPLYVSNRAKHHLERAVWNDTTFLNVSPIINSFSLLYNQLLLWKFMKFWWLVWIFSYPSYYRRKAQKPKTRARSYYLKVSGFVFAVDKRYGLFTTRSSGYSRQRARLWDHWLSQAVHMGQAVGDVGEILTCAQKLTPDRHLSHRVQGEIQEVHVHAFLECPGPLVLGEILWPLRTMWC